MNTIQAILIRGVRMRISVLGIIVFNEVCIYAGSVYFWNIIIELFRCGSKGYQEAVCNAYGRLGRAHTPRATLCHQIACAF